MRARILMFFWCVVFSMLSSGLTGSPSILYMGCNSNVSFPIDSETKYLCSTCRYDIKFRPNNETVLQEFKSYALTTWNEVKTNAKFLQQFRVYLASGDVASISDFQYVINTRKASVDEVKDAFKEMFGGEKKQEIFEAIWSNQSLRSSLFNNPANEVEGLQRFTSLINELSDPLISDPKLYSFIKNQ